MKWNRGIAAWLVSVGILGGIVILFVLPVLLKATAAPDPGTVAPLPDPNIDVPPELSAYEPEVRQLIETTYLGRSKEFPDPEEPAVVLEKYLEQNAHGYQQLLIEDEAKLDTELAEWEELVQLYPESRHAQVGLAKSYRTKAQVTGNIEYTRQAADAYIRATEIGVTHGRIRYTKELSDLLVELGDKRGLEEIFGRLLAQPKDRDRDFYYLALVDYADGLARLSDDRAWGYFEEAIDFHPENNEEAINLYVSRLLDRGRGQKALEVLNSRLTSEQRVNSVVPAFLRKQAMEQAGLDTAPADVEIARILQNRSGVEPERGLFLGTTNPFADTETATAATVPYDNGGEIIMRAAIDSQVSTIFAIGASANMVRQDAIFSPNGAMNNRWLVMSPSTTAKKLAPLKWTNSTAGLARIGTDNRVYYRYFNGSSWTSWSGLSVLPNNHSAVDIAAVVYANNQADIFAVANDHCTIYSSRSVNGTTWGAWQWWGACGDNITAAIMPDGTGFAAIRATGAGNQAAVRYFNGSAWAGSWTGIGSIVNDLALLAYTNPSQVGGIRMGLSAVGSDNCTVYGNNWNGSSWSGWAPVTSCFDKVAAFNTSDGGAYVLFIHRDTDYLYTLRFTGSAWAGLVSHPQGGAWIEAAGANIDDDSVPHEHTQYSDDCRTQNQTCFPDPNVPGACFSADALNLAEVLYNEARSETIGAQAMVGWTVRNRAYQGLSCDSYPGAQGGALTTTCRSTVPCNDPNYCDGSKRICCVVHGGQTQWGTSGYQFNDEHVAFNTLYNGGFAYRAVYILSGRLLDMSNPTWRPSGISGCPATLTCGTSTTGGPLCTSGLNVTELPPAGGPMQFLAYDHCAQAQSCKRYVGDVCGNTPPPPANPIQVPPDSACAQTNPLASGDNFFWNRRP